MSGGNGQHYLAIDIETGGYDKPIFALGAVVFTINEKGEPDFVRDKDGKPVEGMWNFPVLEKDTYKPLMENFDEDTWNNFWGNGPTIPPWAKENFGVLKSMNDKKNCNDEKEVIESFYTWWLTKVIKDYQYIKIVTDEPTFDVGYVDSKIKQYVPGGLPLRFQGKSRNYVSTLDYNTFRKLIEMTYPSNDYPNPTLAKVWGSIPSEFNHDHDPLNDCKDMAYKFAKTYKFMQELLHSKFGKVSSNEASASAASS